METSIPIVDFSCMLTNIGDTIANTNSVLDISKEIIAAFEKIGFVYLRNTGITEKDIIEFNSTCKTFFDLPVSVKQECARPHDSYHGYIGDGVESVEEGRPPDLRESFLMSPGSPALLWPQSSLVPSFRPAVENMYNRFKNVALQILQLLAVGLEYQDLDFFTDGHKLMGKAGSATALRFSYYPPIPEEVMKNQTRCGEHSDYGSLTLLFQDSAGGLQLKTRSGAFIDAKPIPDTILVNIGDSLMRWSADRFLSTRHRVVIPKTEEKKNLPRQSCVFFVTPDDDFIIKCFDNSAKYEPIRAGDYLHYNFHRNFDRNK